MDNRELIKRALEARKSAYTPYSEFQVGAALLTADNTVYTGCNVENAAYGDTICAERTAFVKAISEGHRDFTAIAIVGGPVDGIINFSYPCGSCRQVMIEFCEPDQFRVLIAKSEEVYEEYTLGQILPMSFSPKNLIK